MLQEKGFVRAFALIAGTGAGIYGALPGLASEIQAVGFSLFLFACLLLLHWKRADPAIVDQPVPIQPLPVVAAMPAAPMPMPTRNAIPFNQPERSTAPTRPTAYSKPIVHPGSIEYFVYEEIEAINRLLEAHGVQARVPYTPSVRMAKPFMIAPTSIISYAIDLKPGEMIAKVEKILDELAIALAARRRQLIRDYNGIVTIRLNTDYPLSVEVPHPKPIKLDLQRSDLARLGPNQGLVGMRYTFDGASPIMVDFPGGDYHVLIAGMSGFGKSNVMRLILSSLAAKNAPGALRFMLADLKGKDLVYLADLPHTLAYTDEVGGLDAILDSALQEMESRKHQSSYAYRLIVAIDELALLNKDQQGKLTTLLNLGRDLEIHVVGGNQAATGAEVGPTVIKGFTTRLITRVPSTDSAWRYTTVEKSGANLISQAGDFFLVRSGQLQRVQAYDLPRSANEQWISHLIQQWGERPVPPAVDEQEEDDGDPLEEITDTEGESLFDLMSAPSWKGIGAWRELTPEERSVVRYLAQDARFQTRGELSKTKLTKWVYGSRDPRRDGQIHLALTEKAEEIQS